MDKICIRKKRMKKDERQGCPYCHEYHKIIYEIKAASWAAYTVELCDKCLKLMGEAISKKIKNA